MKKSIALGMIALATSFGLSFAQAQVVVKDGWIRATVPQQQATGAFMQITSVADARLVSVSTPLTPTAEVHEMLVQNDIMKMRQIPAIELPAGKQVDLKPGGYHVMLMNLKSQVKAGDVVPLTLVVEDKSGKRESVRVDVPVRPLTFNAGATAAPMSKHSTP